MIGRAPTPVLALATAALIAACGDDPSGPGGDDGLPTWSFGALYEPPDGRILHGIGQWDGYNDAFLDALPAELLPASELIFIDVGDTPRGWRPAGVAERVAEVAGAGRIPHIDIALRGLQPLPEDRDTLSDPLYGIDDEIAAGPSKYDARIEDVAEIVREHGGPVVVRIGGEFNGSWNGYHPWDFPKAFRKVVDIFDAASADNAVFVWCYMPAAPGDFDERAQNGDWKWYPGDDAVDWFAIDWFHQSEFTGPLGGGRDGAETRHGRTRRFLDMAVDVGRPVMIAESAPAFFDLSDPVQAEAAWQQWFVPYFAILEERPEIKWFHLISYDWTEAAAYEPIGWRNNDLTASPALMERLTEELSDPRYLHVGDLDLLSGVGAGAPGASR